MTKSGDRKNNLSKSNLPTWLRRLIKKLLNKRDDWPNGKYPQVAFDAVDLLCEEEYCPMPGDIIYSFIQVLIDEIERLKPSFLTHDERLSASLSTPLSTGEDNGHS